jgi:hypothetical protein
MKDLIALFAAFLLGFVTAQFTQTDRIVVVNSKTVSLWGCEGVAVGSTRTRPCPGGESGHAVDQCQKIADDRAVWKEINSTCKITK